MCLILGDNVFYGQDTTRVLNRAKERKIGATIFGYPVKDARSFGVVEIAKNVKPFARGEIEITAINNAYLDMGELNVELMGRGVAWLDTCTPDGMLKAAQFAEAVQDRQGF